MRRIDWRWKMKVTQALHPNINFVERNISLRHICNTLATQSLDTAPKILFILSMYA